MKIITNCTIRVLDKTSDKSGKDYKVFEIEKNGKKCVIGFANFQTLNYLEYVNMFDNVDNCKGDK